jgi:hypothetical protein
MTTLSKIDLYTMDTEITELEMGCCDHGARINALQAAFEAECARAAHDPLDIQAEAEQYRKNKLAARSVAFVAPAMGVINHVSVMRKQRERDERAAS